MPFAIGGNQLDTGYEVSNSLRFNDNDDPFLARTPSSEGNRKTWTFSIWFKRSNLTSGALFTAGASGQDETTIRLESNFIDWQLFKVSTSSTIGRLITSQQLRDVSAWYHLVCAYDSTNSTAGDRMKMFLNGNEITSFTTDTNPTQNYDAMINNTVIHNIGRQSWNNSGYFDGYLAEVNLIDGQQLLPTSFGEYNDNGVWIPKEYSGTYGTNGFFMQFKQTGFSANSSGIGADTSGNDNHFSISNLTEIDVTTDTCTNNFITMNPLATNSRGTFTQGNCEISTNVSGSSPFGQVEFGTFAVNKGKWYFEAKLISAGSGGKMGIGINERWETNKYTNGHNNIGSSGNAFYSNQGDIKVGTGSDQSASSYSNDDVIGVAFDLDNSKVYFHKEGVYQRSGDPANGTGGDTLTSSFNDYWTVWVTKDDTNHNTNVKFNFGNAPYSISSGNSDSEGFGNFEYAVPSGYFALCTKNLAEYG